MLRAEKERVVEELTERLRAAETLIVADYRGLTHAELNDVRTELLKYGARFSVCKNTLTRRAAQAAGVPALLDLLEGPTAIAFVHDGDMVAVAKTLTETARATRRLDLRGAVLAGRPLPANAVRELAALPPLDVLRGQVLGAIVAPLTSLLGLLRAPLQELVGLIDARIEQLEARGEGAPRAAAVEEAEDAPAGAAEHDAPAQAPEPEPPAPDTAAGAQPAQIASEENATEEGAQA